MDNLLDHKHDSIILNNILNSEDSQNSMINKCCTQKKPHIMYLIQTLIHSNASPSVRSY